MIELIHCSLLLQFIIMNSKAIGLVIVRKKTRNEKIMVAVIVIMIGKFLVICKLLLVDRNLWFTLAQAPWILWERHRQFEIIQTAGTNYRYRAGFHVLWLTVRRLNITDPPPVRNRLSVNQALDCEDSTAYDTDSLQNASVEWTDRMTVKQKIIN